MRILRWSVTARMKDLASAPKAGCHSSYRSAADFLGLVANSTIEENALAHAL